MSTTVRVALGDRGYDVVVGRGVLTGVSAYVPPTATRAAVVTQPPVADRYASPVVEALSSDGLQVEVIVVPDGEIAKDLATLSELYGELARRSFGRNDLVVAVGGGVVGDLAGFLAATWNRGAPVLQVPTTLLAQVDAAIGGKTAVNLPQGKNLVGAFHQPVGVVADVDTLSTLPQRELTAGLGEVVKAGLIRDADLLELLEEHAEACVAGDPDLLEGAITRAVAVKAEVVSADETEQGLRAILNLGHTYGHAVEAVTGYTTWLHGEAVAVGTLVALRVGRAAGLTPDDLVPRVEELLRRLGLPTAAPKLDRRQVWEVMTRDKKRVGDELRFVVLEDIGRPTVIAPTRAEIDAAIDDVEEA